VDLSVAKIGGDLVCEGGRFVQDAEHEALAARGAEISRVYFRENVVVEGQVCFAHAKRFEEQQ